MYPSHPTKLTEQTLKFSPLYPPRRKSEDQERLGRKGMLERVVRKVGRQSRTGKAGQERSKG
jgi:hypothetical protein